MADAVCESSDSEIDDDSWSIKYRKRNLETAKNKESTQESSSKEVNPVIELQDQCQRFEELKSKLSDIKKCSAKKLYFAEKKRAKKLLKRALKDPLVKELVEKNNSVNKRDCDTQKKEEEKDWKEVKPFLDINKHLHGPVSHGDRRPKTELECKIDNAVEEGDFEKAELLSDTLANQEFAVKISKAYAAKRYHEQSEKEKSMMKDKQSKKIRWTFEAKERWQMKGNM